MYTCRFWSVQLRDTKSNNNDIFRQGGRRFPSPSSASLLAGSRELDEGRCGGKRAFCTDFGGLHPSEQFFHFLSVLCATYELRSQVYVMNGTAVALLSNFTPQYQPARHISIYRHCHFRLQTALSQSSADPSFLLSGGDQQCSIYFEATRTKSFLCRVLPDGRCVASGSPTCAI